MDEFKYMYAVCVNLILTVGSLERKQLVWSSCTL